MTRDRNALLYWTGGPLAAVVMGASLIPFRELTQAANLTFAFMALTIVMAAFGGRAVGIATAVASALSLDFFLTRPYFRLAIEDKHDVIAFLGLAVCGIIASALGGSRHGEPRESADDAALRTELRVREIRDLAWTHLRWGLFFSIAIWVEALWHPFPGFLAWAAVLAQGFFLALATGYAAVQEHWMRGGAVIAPKLKRVQIDKPWSDVEDVGSALWFALGLMSLVPWAYVALGRKAPVDVLYGALACSATVLLLLALTALIRVRPPLDGTMEESSRGRPSA